MKTLLVIKYRALGDSVISLGTLQYLREILPETKIIFATPWWTADLYSKAKIAADEVFGFKLQKPTDWFSMWHRLRRREIDGVFEMFQSGRTSTFFKLYSPLNGTPYFAHNHHKKSGPVHDQGVIKPVIQRDLDGAWTFFGKDKNLPVPSHLKYCPEFKFEKINKEKRIILGTVATRETKMYPLDMMARLSNIIKSEFPDYQIIAPISNSKMDAQIEEQLKKHNCSIEFVKMKLNELPQFFANSTLYIGNDTGLKHIAIASGIKSLTLFGPEPPTEWHPYDTNLHPRLFLDPLDCRYEKGHYCGLSKCSSMICLKSFSPEMVWGEAQNLLRTGGV